MKKLFIFILFIGLLSSCNDIPVKVENPDKETTYEIIEKSKQDTTLYKLVEMDEETIYAINTTDNKVVYKFENYSGTAIAVVFIFLIIIIGISTIAIIILT